MKSVGTAYWNSPNTGATNESGFSALPGGHRTSYGSFNFIRTNPFFWSATEYENFFAWYRSLNVNDGDVKRRFTYKSSGASVRCLRD
jgi:uncharacterized protein (TIGR02145 family)